MASENQRVYFGMPLSRRAALKGLSAAFLGSPFVPMLEARGQLPNGPKRFVVLWQPNGTIVDEYVPKSGGERDFRAGSNPGAGRVFA